MKPDRPKKLYFKIGVVCRFLHETDSCIRFWLRTFRVTQKRGEQDRFWRHFTRDQIAKLKLIRHFLRDRGMSIYEAKMELAAMNYGPDPTSEEQLRMLRMGIDG